MADGAKAKIVLSAEDKTKAAFDSAKAGLKEIGDKATGIGANFGTIGVALAAAFEGASIKGVIDAGDELAKLSQKTGITVESLSALKYAGSLADVSIDDLATGVRKLGNSMADAVGGSKEAQAAFKAIGVNVKTASGGLRSTDEVLGDIADKFAGYEDGAAKAALATALFGKNGAALIPLLNGGRKALEESRAEAERFGAIMGPDFAKQAEAFNDNLTKITTAIQASKISLANELLPTLNAVAEAFLATRENGEKFSFIGEVIKTALETVAIVGANVAYVIKQIGLDIISIGEGAVAVATLNFAKAAEIHRKRVEAAEQARKEIDAFEQRVLSAGRRQGQSASGFTPGAGVNPANLFKKGAPVIGDTTKATVSEYERLIRTLKERGAAEQAEMRIGQKLSEADRFGLEIVQKLADGHNKLTDAQKRSATAQLEQVLIAIKANAAREEAVKAQAAASEIARRQVDDLTRETQERIASNQSLREYIEEIGLTADQIEQVRIKRLEDAKAIEEQALAAALNADASGAEVAARQQNVELLRQQIELRRKAAEVEKQDANDPQRGTKRAIDEYVKQAEQAGVAAQDLTKRTIGGLEDGLTNLLSGRKADFKSLVDDMLAELLRLQVVRPLLASLFGGGGGAALGGLFSGGLGSLLSSFGGFFAEGGTLGAGKWGIAGERGPEWIKGPAQVVPAGVGSGATVNDNRTLYIDGTADVAKTQQQTAEMLAAYDRSLWQRLRASGVSA
jgi:lambda family phage tail tape measure protein